MGKTAGNAIIGVLGRRVVEFKRPVLPVETAAELAVAESGDPVSGQSMVPCRDAESDWPHALMYRQMPPRLQTRTVTVSATTLTRSR